MSYGTEILFPANIILRGRRMDGPGRPRDAAVAAVAAAAGAAAEGAAQ
jgi:hypothetical protein